MRLRSQKGAVELMKLSVQLSEKLDAHKDAVVAVGQDPQQDIAGRASYEEIVQGVSQVLFVYALVMNLRSELRSGGLCSMQHYQSCALILTVCMLVAACRACPLHIL